MTDKTADEIKYIEQIALYAHRWCFLSEHWSSTLHGVQLHKWIDENSLRLGGVTAALDYAIQYHENSERHIAS